MAFEDNRPDLARLERQLRVSAAAQPALGIDVATVDPDLLADMLEASIDFVEDAARTRFNGIQIREVRDGNGTQGMELFRWPVGRIREVKVELPVLGLTRIYSGTEIKTYRFQGRFSLFTFKLQAEHASLHLDAQVHANLLPTMPQCIFITYTYGFPQYDAGADCTTWDGTAENAEAGDTRDELDKRHVKLLQTAVILDAAASFLAQAAGLGVGLVQAVSFDGFSKTLNPQAYGPQIEAMINRRDEILNRRRRSMHMATVGG